jgi:hypothetical protein
MARRRNARRHCGKSYPLSAWSLAGRRQGRPRPWHTGGTASIRTSKRRLSWMFAALRRRASGMPRASVMRWRLEPARPRSVGLGPVSSPPFWPEQTRCRRKHGSSRWHRPDPDGRAGRDAACPAHRRLASRAAVASTSSPTRSPSLAAAFPTANRSSKQTQCRSARPGAGLVAGRLSISAAPVVAAARSGSTIHRKREAWPCCPQQPARTAVPGSVRYGNRVGRQCELP